MFVLAGSRNCAQSHALKGLGGGSAAHLAWCGGWVLVFCAELTAVLKFKVSDRWEKV